MKNIITYLSAFSLFVLFISCSTQATMTNDEVKQLIDQKQFTFVAERANPLDGTVNNIMNSIPGVVGNRIMNLDSGYELVVNGDQLSVYLPYFGRAYNVQYGSRNNGFDFKSEKFSYVSEIGKKNTQNLAFTIQDQPNFKQFYLNIQPNGRATLSVNSNDRQPISYFGYITKNKSKD